MNNDIIVYSLEEALVELDMENKVKPVFGHNVKTGARKNLSTIEEAQEFFGITQVKTGSKDPFRTIYRELKDEEKSQVNALKNKAGELWDILETINATADKRCISIAKTKLEEAIMWGTKGITA